MCGIVACLGHQKAVPFLLEGRSNLEHHSYDNTVRDSNYTYYTLYLGRRYNFHSTLEGTLKLKENSYFHADGGPAAEMKPRPITLIDLYVSDIFIASNMSSYDKIISNIEKVKARKGEVYTNRNEGNTPFKKTADYYIEIQRKPEAVTPKLSVMPLQLLVNHKPVMRGSHVGQPQNLCKSVTAE